jgi:hypothetical protein
MQRREKILALLAAGAVAAWLVLPRLGDFFLAPLRSSQERLADVQTQLSEQTKAAAEVKQAGVQLKHWRSRSLPPNPLDAQRLYQAWLTDLSQMAGFKNVQVMPGRRIPQGQDWTSILVSLQGEASLAQLSQFLFHFYRSNLAHRITTLVIESPDSGRNVPVNISLTAEGLSVVGTAPRSTLAPQTVLKSDFRSQASEQSIEVDDSSAFPTEPGFRVRIGNEYLTVVAASENSWKVVGGVDATSPASHRAGDIVMLDLVNPEHAHATLDDFRSLVEHSPFVKPAPPSAEPARSEPVAEVDNSAEQTYLAASITEDEEPQAWLYRRGASTQRIVLRKGSQLDVGDIHAVVVEIRRDYIVLQNGESTWRLDLGQNLKSLRAMPQPSKNGETAPAGEDSLSPDGDSRES